MSRKRKPLETKVMTDYQMMMAGKLRTFKTVTLTKSPFGDYWCISVPEHRRLREEMLEQDYPNTEEGDAAFLKDFVREYGTKKRKR